MGKHRVCYFYDGVPATAMHHHTSSALWFSFATDVTIYADEVSGLYYGPKHPMKPHRITMTHHLVLAYDLHNYFDMYVRFPSSYAPRMVR